jgi:crossover junction endodeoxyribonuclease RuvC
MIVAGIDPGKTGALSILYPDRTVQSYDVPLQKKGKKELPSWNQWQRQWAGALEFSAPAMIVVELVAARPGQGVTSMFNFGRTLGFVHALAAAVDCPVHFVTPSVWNREFGLIGADKNASREKFRELFPASAKLVARVKDGGRAEAALIAEYGRRKLV